MTSKIFKPTLDEKRPGWYMIPGFENYRANRKGEILNTKTGNFTKGGMSDRYLRVSVYRTGAKKPTLEYTHDLVCRAFKGLPPKGMVCIHKDNNRTNTKPTNLTWATQSDNIKQTYTDGLRKPTTKENLKISKESLIIQFLF